MDKTLIKLYLFLLLLCALPAQAQILSPILQLSPASSPWAGRRAITIDHTKVGGSDSTNFPVLFQGTYTYLKTTGNGGSVTNANGYDIVFYSDSALTTKLNYEQESWSATTGLVSYWIQVPTVSHTADTVIYMGYGNSSITTDQSNMNGTWDSTYAAVLHLKPNGSAVSGVDSTSHANNMTPGGSGFTLITGVADGAVTGNGTFNMVGPASSASLDGLSNITVSLWLKTTTTLPGQGSSAQIPFSKYASSTNGEWYITPGGATAVNNQMDFKIVNASNAGVNLVANLGSAYTDGNWHYMVGTYNGSTMTAYYDGVSKGTTSQTGTIANATTAHFILFNIDNTLGNFPGSIDEARVSNVVRSADWIAATFNNQSSPSTFYSVGAPY